MIIKTNPQTNFPDTERIKDEIIKTFGQDLGELFMKNLRDTYDDIAMLENVERVTSLVAGTGPTADLERRGKYVLLEGTGGAADGLYICEDTGGGGYAWKKIAKTTDIVSTFLGLTDTPSSYSGQGGKYLRVNTGASAVEFSAVSAGDMSYADTRFKVGSFTRDTSVASGTQAVTGVGFSPKTVIFFMAQTGTEESSIGFDNLTAMAGIDCHYDGNTNQWGAYTIFSIMDAETNANKYYGNISSLDADGFTISWTKAGLPTGTITIIYLTLR